MAFLRRCNVSKADLQRLCACTELRQRCDTSVIFTEICVLLAELEVIEYCSILTSN